MAQALQSAGLGLLCLVPLPSLAHLFGCDTACDLERVMLAMLVCLARALHKAGLCKLLCKKQEALQA